MKIYCPTLFFLGLLTSCSSEVSSEIVLVDVAEFDRLTIAREIQVIDSLNPRVLAIDLQFSTNKEFFSDSVLAASLAGCKNLVMTSVVERYSPSKEIVYDSLSGSLSHFLINAKTGFANVIYEDDEVGTLKKFSTFERLRNNKTEYHFAVRVAMRYDSMKAMDFVQNNPRVNIIDYSGNAERFKILSAYSVLHKQISINDIQGKIVLIGSFSAYDRDIFFSPLNSHSEPLQPDMFGVVYLANIVAQVLGK